MDKKIRLARLRVFLAMELVVRKTTRKKRRARQWIAARDRLGATSTLIREMAGDDQRSYKTFMWMKEDNFNFILQRVYNSIQKGNTVMRDALPAKIKLEVVLRLLASGESLTSLQYLYRVPKSTISTFLPEVLDAIYVALRTFIKVPTTAEEWLQIADCFNSRWNFPQCVGALDGKHVVVQCPPHSTSLFSNYKGSFSVVLLALVDHDYCFTAIDIGAYGSQADSTIFSNSSLKKGMENGKLNVPEGHIIVADEGFPLKPYMLTPYPSRNGLGVREKVFNYRLCQVRRNVENAFGILSSRFRIFHRPMCFADATVIKIVKATCALHNFLRKTESVGFSEGSENLTRECGMVNLASTRDHRHSNEARQVRDAFAGYFVGEGEVPWQYERIN